LGSRTSRFGGGARRRASRCRGESTRVSPPSRSRPRSDSSDRPRSRWPGRKDAAARLARHLNPESLEVIRAPGCGADPGRCLRTRRTRFQVSAALLRRRRGRLPARSSGVEPGRDPGDSWGNGPGRTADGRRAADERRAGRKGGKVQPGQSAEEEAGRSTGRGPPTGHRCWPERVSPPGRRLYGLSKPTPKTRTADGPPATSRRRGGQQAGRRAGPAWPAGSLNELPREWGRASQRVRRPGDPRGAGSCRRSRQGANSGPPEKAGCQHVSVEQGATGEDQSQTGAWPRSATEAP